MNKTIQPLKLVFLIAIILLGCGKKNFSVLNDGEFLIGITPITINNQNNTSPTTNSDGSIVLYSSKDGRINNIFLSKEPFNSTQIKKTDFYANCLHPSLSDSGDKFCFTSDRYGDYDIFIMKTNYSLVAHRLTSSIENDDFPSFSKDGKNIVYCRFDNKTIEWSIRIHNLQNDRDEEIVKA
jgi:Tol biopolymer transport system component